MNEFTVMFKAEMVMVMHEDKTALTTEEMSAKLTKCLTETFDKAEVKSVKIFNTGEISKENAK